MSSSEITDISSSSSPLITPRNGKNNNNRKNSTRLDVIKNITNKNSNPNLNIKKSKIQYSLYRNLFIFF